VEKGGYLAWGSYVISKARKLEISGNRCHYCDVTGREQCSSSGWDELTKARFLIRLTVVVLAAVA
jgi:hypothetical protein